MIEPTSAVQGTSQLVGTSASARMTAEAISNAFSGLIHRDILSINLFVHVCDVAQNLANYNSSMSDSSVDFRSSRFSR